MYSNEERAWIDAAKMQFLLVRLFRELSEKTSNPQAFLEQQSLRTIESVGRAKFSEEQGKLRTPIAMEIEEFFNQVIAYSAGERLDSPLL
ncbi:MAG: hypothetical protein F8N39_11545 [Clostridiaceae bacterium]|nr:hypothetical protein [Clostridiaceae bacterium]